MSLCSVRLHAIVNLDKSNCRPAEPCSKLDIILYQFKSVFLFFIEPWFPLLNQAFVNYGALESEALCSTSSFTISPEPGE